MAEPSVADGQQRDGHADEAAEREQPAAQHLPQPALVLRREPVQRSAQAVSVERRRQDRRDQHDRGHAKGSLGERLSRIGDAGLRQEDRGDLGKGADSTVAADPAGQPQGEDSKGDDGKGGVERDSSREQHQIMTAQTGSDV